MDDPIEDDDIFELPGGDEKVRLPKEEGERTDPKGAAGKPGGVPADESDDEVAPGDQLGMARRHNRRLETRLKQYAKANAGLLERVREHDDLLHRLTRSNLQSDLRSVQGSVSAAESRLIQARDDGDRQAELAAERDLAKERSRLDALERAVSSADQERQPAPTPDAADTAADPRLEVAKELADEWSRKHKWYGDAEAIEDSEIVRAVSTAIANDPKNPLPIDDPEHFDELDRRLTRRLPERYRPARRNEPMQDDDQPDVPGTRGTSRRTNPAEGNGAAEMPKSLTQQQLKVYTAMGFNWADEKDQEKIIAMQKQLDEERKDRRHG